MITAKCNNCGSFFYREEDEIWKTKCLSCWKKTAPAKSDHQIKKLKNQLLALETTNEYLRDVIYNKNQELEFISKHLKFLIFACHPDRNPGFTDVAHEILVWLNSKRK